MGGFLVTLLLVENKGPRLHCPGGRRSRGRGWSNPEPAIGLGSWPPAGAGSSADTPRDHWPLWPLLRDSRWIQGSSSEGGDGKGRGIEQGHTWESPEQVSGDSDGPGLRQDLGVVVSKGIPWVGHPPPKHIVLRDHTHPLGPGASAAPEDTGNRVVFSPRDEE